ncbi:MULTISPECIES: LysR family transcriptional regulator [Pseudomonas]|uniref:LysR family transcriptional regulator n=1 Tax=Pseudomonas piscis TaxID=2614538 RepID=A0A7X1PLP5_9PSED|nr:MULTISPECIES: LysR family transcriptional regulator [Pseudomonas]AZC18222.1 transcriptional regulator MexT [Pseudomonas sp. CMR5c]MQA54521.1 LysR family transcriptional regulator [Pseudomonas piscis]POA55343.1 LysR family transcriptional regulator [Pseudomonas sp. FW507-12TSA]
MPSTSLDPCLLRSLDLNALVAFVAVYRERNVSHAAHCLGLTQPAVSNVLGKLRRRFNDPLFLRTGRQLAPTPFAIRLAEDLQPALGALEVVLAGYPQAPSGEGGKFFQDYN